MTRLIAEGWQQPPRLPDCEAIAAPLPPGSIAQAEMTLDDATLAYVGAARAPFELLRQAAGQIAGVLVLAVSSGRGAAGHPMLDLANNARREAGDTVMHLRPPSRGAHHHRHLVQAAGLIGLSLDASRLHLSADDGRTNAVLRPLRAGFQELHWAASALPGFEVVAFSQGCCARHRHEQQPEPRA